MRDSSRLVKNFSTPLTGGASSVGLVASMTCFRSECLDEVRAGELALKPLHERFIEAGKELQYTVDWRRVFSGIGRVDDVFPRQGLCARRTKRFRRCLAFDRQNDQFAVCRRVGEAADANLGTLCCPLH